MSASYGSDLYEKIPLAIRKIPYFQFFFNKEALPWLERSIQSMESFSLFSPWEKEQPFSVLYCLMFANPENTDEFFLQVAKQLEIPHTALLAAASFAKRTTLFQTVLRENKSLLTTENTEQLSDIILFSIFSGVVETMECIEENWTSSEPIISVEVVRGAVFFSTPEMVQYLLSKVKFSKEEIQELFFGDTKYGMFHDAVKNGSFSTLLPLCEVASQVPGLLETIMNEKKGLEVLFSIDFFQGEEKLLLYLYEKSSFFRTYIDITLSGEQYNIDRVRRGELSIKEVSNNRFTYLQFVSHFPLLICFKKNEEVKLLLSIPVVREHVKNLKISLEETARGAGNEEIIPTLRALSLPAARTVTQLGVTATWAAGPSEGENELGDAYSAPEPCNGFSS